MLRLVVLLPEVYKQHFVVGHVGACYVLIILLWAVQYVNYNY